MMHHCGQPVRTSLGTVSTQPTLLHAADDLLLASPRRLRPDGTLSPGWLRVRVGRVDEQGYGVPPSTPDHEAAYLSPALVDIHCHGGGGHTFATTDAAEAAAAVAVHRAHGTGSVTASLVTAPIEVLEAQVRTLVPLAREGVISGIHLEGPWLSPLHRGAHDPALLRDPAPEDVRRLLVAAEGQLRMVTLAPELPGALAAVAELSRHGVVVAVGHTDADEEQFRAAVDAGARVVTHLCNAMRPIHHRAPGPVTAALADPRVAVELIADGVHVHPDVLDLLARSARSAVVLVTDAMAAAGSGDGRYLLGALEVDVVDGVARLAGGGSIAGSTLTLERAVRTAVSSGIPVGRALGAATYEPSRVLGLPGQPDGFVAWGEDLHPRLALPGRTFP